MTRRVPQDRRRRGAVVDSPRYPSGVEFAARLAGLRFHLPPVDVRKLRRRKRGKR